MAGAPGNTPVRLADLIREGKLLWTYCNDHFREVDLDPVTIPLPADFPVPEVGKRIKCSRCGSRNVSARLELYSGGIEARRAKFRPR